MLAVIQRVAQATVTIHHKTFSEIGTGLLILLGIGHDDTQTDAEWLATKIANLRIFSDNEGKMNLSAFDINAEILVVSQFTLLASTQKGTRPSFTDAAKPSLALPLYEYFVEKMGATLNKGIKTGQFGADMQVSLSNDGPVTIIIDTKNKK